MADQSLRSVQEVIAPITVVPKPSSPSCPLAPEFTEASSPLTELQALARSTLESLLVSVLKTFIFSTRHVRAVSVASPTFS